MKRVLLGHDKTLVANAINKSGLRTKVNLISEMDDWVSHITSAENTHDAMISSLRTVVSAYKASQAAASMTLFMRSLSAMAHLERSRQLDIVNLPERVKNNECKDMPGRADIPRAITGDEIAIAHLLNCMTPETSKATWLASAALAYRRSCVLVKNNETKELRATYESYAMGMCK
jgi:hypothetical protein